MGTIVSLVRSSLRLASSDTQSLTNPSPAQPPELEILEIGDLSTDRFRGIFRLTYSGDAHITLQTKVQVGQRFRHRLPRPSHLTNH